MTGPEQGFLLLTSSLGDPHRKPLTVPQFRELAKRVQAKYYVLKLGSRGAYVYNGRQCYLMPAIAEKAVDTTAAGDSFTAAMTLRYLENGGDILDAVRFGNVVGGISVTRPGASESIPTREEAERYLATHPGR